MAKLKPDKIEQADLIEFLDSHSDFSFELATLLLLKNLDFTCEHNGTYEDSVTKKAREFDIRATRKFNNFFLRLAVECKNLRENSPLLISCVPRKPNEAFHEIVISADPDKVRLDPHSRALEMAAMIRRSRNIKMTGQHSLYQTGDPVGKSCDQIGRTLNGDISSNDSDVFQKWSQALSSANDLTYDCCRDGEERTAEGLALSLAFPILVVPDDRLWITEYDENGNRKTDPVAANRASYFINLDYSHRSIWPGDQYTISHLEFVTHTGLTEFVNLLCGDADAVNKWFPTDHATEQNARMAT